MVTGPIGRQGVLSTPAPILPLEDWEAEGGTATKFPRTLVNSGVAHPVSQQR